MESTRKHVVGDRLCSAPFLKTEVLSGRRICSLLRKERRNVNSAWRQIKTGARRMGRRRTEGHPQKGRHLSPRAGGRGTWAGQTASRQRGDAPIHFLAETKMRLPTEDTSLRTQIAMAWAAGSKFASVLHVLLLLRECARAAGGREYGTRPAGPGPVGGWEAGAAGDRRARQPRPGTRRNAAGVREPCRGVAPSPTPEGSLPVF